MTVPTFDPNTRIENRAESNAGSGIKGNSAAVIGYALLLTSEFICLHSATVLADLILPSHALASLFALCLMAGQVALFALCAFFVRSTGSRRLFISSLCAGGLFAAGIIAVFLLGGTDEPLVSSLQAILLIGGACMGLASGLFNLLWAHVFSSLPTGQLYRQVIISYLLALLVYLVITLLPPRAIAPIVLVCVIGSASLLALISQRPASYTPCAPTRPLLGRAAQLLWRPVLCTAMFAFMSGLMSQISGQESVTLAAFQQISIVASLIVVGILLLPALFLKHPPGITSAYRIALPITAAGFLLLPFIWNALFGVTNALVHMGSMAVFILLWCFLVDASTQTRLPIGLIFGSCLGITKLANLIGLFIGFAFADSITQSALTLAAVALVSIYLLSMVSLFIFKGQRTTREQVSEAPKVAEETRATLSSEDSGASGAVLGAVPGDTALPPSPESRFQRQCETLTQQADLTRREQDIMLLLGQGHSVASISRLLYVTENTTKSHVRNIYRKLDIHSKQELIDLLNKTA